MEWRIPVRLEGEEVAQLRCTGDGLRTAFFLDCPEKPGLFKLWLEGNGAFLLGTPMPTAGRLVLKKLVSNRQLEFMRPITSASLVPAGEKNVPRKPNQGEGALPEEITDPELREQLSGSGFRAHREGERLILARPWQPGQEFPAPALFTLMQWENGRLSLCLEQGWPVV